MLRLWLVLMTLAALALAVLVPAVDNDDWHVDGQRAVLPVEGCTQFRGALLLSPGSAAMYRFNGTSVAVIGAVYEEGAEALIELEGQQRRVNAHSRQRKCAEFAKFDNLNAGTLHTIRISVTGGQGDRRAVFPLIALDITPPPSSGPVPPEEPSSGPKPPDSPPSPAPPADPTTKPLPTRPVTPIPSSTEEDDDDKPTSSSTRKPDDSKPTSTPSDDANSEEDDEDGQDSTLTEQPPSSSVDGAGQPPLTVDSNTITASDDSPNPSDTPDSSLNNTDVSTSSSGGSSGPKASTLVPAILIPILILLALGAFAIWFIRRRRRTRLPPSAEWRMANPNYGGWYGSSEQMSEVAQPWAPPAPSGYGADGRPWSPFQDDGRGY